MAPAIYSIPAIVTAPDRQRLRQTIRTLREIVGDPYHYYLATLERRLAEAVIVPHDGVPDDVVTMHSKVRLHYGLPFRWEVVTLVYVDEANPVLNNVSVVTPMGTSLLGARKDQTIRWRARFGERLARVEAIQFQPEAAERRVNQEHHHDRATH